MSNCRFPISNWVRGVANLCRPRTYGFRGPRGTFRFVPKLSETFRFVPFCSVWFRTDFLLPGAELRVLSAEC